MRITMVQAPRWSIFTPSYAVALLTGNLRTRGHTVFQKDFDPDMYNAVGEDEKRLWQNENSNFWNSEASVRRMISDYGSAIDRMVDEILHDSPQIVGFSVKMWSLWFSEALAERVKRLAGDVTVVFGGPHMSAVCPREYLAAHGAVDAVCRREADLSFPLFLERMAAKGALEPVPGFAVRDGNGAVRDGGEITEVPAVSDIPFADYSDYDLGRYLNPNAVTMLLSRGCVNRCSFCAESPLFPRFRPYPAERVMAEIEHHSTHSSVARPMRIFFNDSLLNGSAVELDRLAGLLIARRSGLRVEYGGMMAIREDLTDDLVGRLADSGLTDVLFGVESGSEAVLARMRKPYNLATAERVFESFHRRGILVVASVIFGHPGETETEFHKSLNFLRANAHNIDGFLLNDLGIYAGSDICRHPDRYGVEPCAIGTGADWVGEDGRNTLALRTERLNLARALLGDKVSDIGGFTSGSRPLYHPADALRRKVQHLESLVVELSDRCRESVRIRETVESVGLALGWFDRLTETDGQCTATGWARDPAGNGPAAEVVLVDSAGTVLACCHPCVSRKDVSRELGDAALEWSGWEACFPAARMSVGATIRAFAYDAVTGRAFRLGGEFTPAGRDK